MSAPISTTIRTHEATGQRYAVNIYHDHVTDAPWDGEDGHGPVRRMQRHESKRPGERVLRRDGYEGWLYDWQAAMRLARADKWGVAPADDSQSPWLCARSVGTLARRAAAKASHDPLGEWLGLTRGEIAERAVQADFDRLAGWLRDEWSYVCVAVVLLGDDDADGDPVPLTGRYDHACWGFESDCDDSDMRGVITDLLADALATRQPQAPALLDEDARARVNAYAEREGWALIDVDSTGLYEIERDDEAGRFASDDDAVAHVRRCTAAGSVLHSEALETHDNDAAALSAHRAEPQAVHFATENPNVTVQFKPIPTHPETAPGPLRTFMVTMQYPYTKWCEKVIEVEAVDEAAARAAAYEREAEDDEDGGSFWDNSYEVGDGDAGETTIVRVHDLGEVEPEPVADDDERHHHAGA